MNLRTHVLAGLIAAAAVPTLASAAPYVGIGDLQQRAELGLGGRSHGGMSAEFFAAHQRAMNVGVSHLEASQQAARQVEPAKRDVGRPQEFFSAHWRAMRQGVSHLEASQQAAREVDASRAR